MIKQTDGVEKFIVSLHVFVEINKIEALIWCFYFILFYLYIKHA